MPTQPTLSSAEQAQRGFPPYIIPERKLPPKTVPEEIYDKLYEFFEPRVKAAQSIGQSIQQVYQPTLNKNPDVHPISEQLADMFDPRYASIAKFTSDMYSRMKKQLQEKFPIK